MVVTSIFFAKTAQTLPANPQIYWSSYFTSPTPFGSDANHVPYYIAAKEAVVPLLGGFRLTQISGFTNTTFTEYTYSGHCKRSNMHLAKHGHMARTDQPRYNG